MSTRDGGTDSEPKKKKKSVRQVALNLGVCVYGIGRYCVRVRFVITVGK